MSRRLCGAVLFILLFIPAAFWTRLVEAEESGRLFLSEVLDLAREKNPEIRAARENWQAARYRVSPAATWPDPTVFFSKEKTPAGERMNHLVLEQNVPFPGKLSSEGRMKHHEARIAESKYRARTLEVLTDIRTLYYGLYKTDRLLEELSQNVEVMKSTLRLAETRLATSASSLNAGDRGAAPSVTGTDVFSISTELGRMENMLFEQRQQRTLVQIELNSLLDRDLRTPVGRASAPDLREIPLSLEDLLKMAQENDPLYLISLHEQNHAEAMLSHARLGYAPDFGVMYDRQTNAGRTGYESGVRLSVPLWLWRPRAHVKEARSHITEAEAASRAMRNEVFKMVSMEFTEVHTHLTLSKNYETAILPSAESAFRLARRQYESGNADFVRLLETVRALLAAQIDYYEQLNHYAEHWSLLEQWVGVPLAGEKEGLFPTQEKTHE